VYASHLSNRLRLSSVRCTSCAETTSCVSDVQIFDSFQETGLTLELGVKETMHSTEENY